MRARVGVLASVVLLLAAVGCGDDGGGDDLAAFCDELEAFSDDVADGDLTSNRGLEGLVDRLNELLELGEQFEDEIVAVGDELGTARTGDAAEMLELIQDELGDIAEDDCDIRRFADFEVDEEADDTTTTAPEVDDTTTTAPDVDPPAGDLNPVTAAIDPADVGVEPGFEENVDLCFRGLMQACDNIFFGENGQAAAPDGSVARTYGGTCGGRILEFNVVDAQRCTENLFASAEFDAGAFNDASFADLAAACRGTDVQSPDGSMAACDELFATTPIGSAEELYGFTCGGRILETVAARSPGTTSCVAIFGPVAEFG